MAILILIILSAVILWANETETCYWTNLQMYRASLDLKPIKEIKISLCYNYLRANEQVAAGNPLLTQR